MQGNEKWRAAASATSPSARLRAARTMPQWLQVRGSGLPPPPPPPPDNPPPIEPDYEVIEFPAQQTYSNTPLHRNIGDGKERSDGKRCDLCGSSSPAVRCSQCNQQTFCISCDEMYHRHPKRQAHIRKDLSDGAAISNRPTQPTRPPLPPKGESTPAPVPPPRRNKRFLAAQRTGTLDQGGPATNRVGFVGSLKRIINPRQQPFTPFYPDGQVPVGHSPIEFQEHINPLNFRQQNGMNDWQMFKGHRSGSFGALNGPGFSPMMQAHSMAQLNCASCHHGPPMWNDWSHGGPPPMGPWGDIPPPGSWHSTAWLNQPMRNEVSHGSSSRRSSFRSERRRNIESGSTGSDEDERMSTRGGRGGPQRNMVSPALSRRSRPTVQSEYDSEDEEEEENARRTWRNPSNRTAALQPHVSQLDHRRLPTRRASLVEGNARPYRHQDDDTLSTHGGARRLSSTLSHMNKSNMLADDRGRGSSGHFEPITGRHNDHEKTNSSHRNRKYYYDDNSSIKGESYSEEISSARSSQRASDLEDSQTLSERKKSSDTMKNNVRSNNRGKSRHERVSETVNTRRTSPVHYRNKNRGEPSSDSLDENSLAETLSKNNLKAEHEEIEATFEDNENEGEEEEEMGPIPETEWDCIHCTFVNEPGSRVCAVCCKTTMRPKAHKSQPPDDKIKVGRNNSEKKVGAEHVRHGTIAAPAEKNTMKPSPKSSSSAKVEAQQTGRGLEEENELNKRLTSKGTSPPPQSISTQTYDVGGYKLKRTASLADYEWKSPQRSHSRQSLLSDTHSLPVTPPKGRSPDRFSQTDLNSTSSAAQSLFHPQRKTSEPAALFTSNRNTRRAGSQPPDYMSSLVQKQVRQGMEMVKLMKEAEDNGFSADDLAVALTHSEDEDPVEWLKQNWRNMIDTVVTLATNYGHERKENTVGTISASEARDALRLHDGNVWAAVTECVDQRQRKYAELLSRGNFSREDIVTMLTAHHGNLEDAYTELNKSQLKPFLMRIWGPPQSSNHDNADFTKLAHDEGAVGWGGGGGSGSKLLEQVSHYNNINDDRINKWLEHGKHYKRNSESMMHLNYIGQSDTTIQRTTSYCNLNRKPINSRNSDINRYLECYFKANNNSLKIRDNDKTRYTSLINLNNNSLYDYRSNISDNISLIEAINKGDNIRGSAVQFYRGNEPSSSASSQFNFNYTEQVQYENLEVPNNNVNDSGTSSSNELNAERERFINEVNALRQAYEGETNVKLEENDVQSDISTSESSYESLSASDDLQENLLEEDLTLKYDQSIGKRNETNSHKGIIDSTKHLVSSPVSDSDPLEQRSPNNVNATAVNQPLVQVPVENLAVYTPVSEKEQYSPNNVATEVKQPLVDVPVENPAGRTYVYDSVALEQRSPNNAASEFKKELVKIPVENLAGYHTPVSEKEQRSPNNVATAVKQPLVEVPVENLAVYTPVSEKEQRSPNNVATAVKQPLVEVPVENLAVYTPVSEKEQRSPNHVATEAKQQLGDVPIKNLAEDMPVSEKEQRSPNNVATEVRQQLNDVSANNETLLLNNNVNHPKQYNNEINQQTFIADPEIIAIEQTELNLVVDINNGAVNNGQTLLINEFKSGKEVLDEVSSVKDKPDIINNDGKLVREEDKEINGHTGEEIVNEMETDKRENLKNKDRDAASQIDLTAVMQELANKEEKSKEPYKEYINEIILNEGKLNTLVINNENSEDVVNSRSDDNGGSNSQKTADEVFNESNKEQTIANLVEINVSASAQIPGTSSANSPVTAIYKKHRNDNNSHLVTIASDGNSDKDISSLPTDSEKDLSSISEDIAVISSSGVEKDKVEVELISSAPSQHINDINVDNNKKQEVNEVKEMKGEFENNLDSSSNQLLTLLKESLSKEDVVERIVSTLFQTVLRASVDLQCFNNLEQNSSAAAVKRKLTSETSSNCQSESEENSDSIFFETPENMENDRNRGNGEIEVARKSSRAMEEAEDYVNVEGNGEDSEERVVVSVEDVERSECGSPPVVITDDELKQKEIRRVLAEGLVKGYEQAELAVELMAMKFDEEQSILAAKECKSLQTAITFLQQECYLCAGKYSLKQMISMLECDHRCCIECANNYFTLQITERSINDCVCPFCKEPDLSKLEEDRALNYFSNLDIFLKAIVQHRVHELFQRKLRDRTLMQDPNFKWCIKCSSGFIANPQQKRLICPDCKTITCAKCKLPWEKEHDKMSCEEFAAWKEYNDPDNQLSRHLEENGVTCPKCNNRYILSKGGCMHLTCPQCKYEFCSGCGKQFLMGSKCKVSDYCEKLGLHSHHPRNCLFYLRDKEPALLQKLLEDNGIAYKRNETQQSKRCNIQLLRETADGLVETECGYPIEEEGLCRMSAILYLRFASEINATCRRYIGVPSPSFSAALSAIVFPDFLSQPSQVRTHFIEHLVDIINIERIDPAPAMDLTDAQQELRRHGKTVPIRPEETTDRAYLDSCIKMILEEIPLE